MIEGWKEAFMVKAISRPSCHLKMKIYVLEGPGATLSVMGVLE
jgi:hypothetical protein